MSTNGHLPAGWVWTTLGDVFIWSSGGTPDTRTANYYDGDIPWVNSGELEDTRITQTKNTITEAGLMNSSAKWVQPGSVLIAMYGATIGKLAIAGMPLTTNQAIAFTSPQPIESKYLFYYLLAQRENLVGMGKGAAQRNISQTIIRSFPFLVAPLAEQRRIVAAIEQQFTRLDAGVAALKRAQAALKRYRAAVLKAAVEGKLSEEWRAAHPDVEPAASLLARILAERRARWEADLRAKGKDPTKAKYEEPKAPDTASLPEVPEGWCWATVDQVGDVQGGIQKQPKRTPKDNAYPYLRVANVLRGRLDLTQIEYMELFGNELESLRLHDGDVLIVEGNGSRTEIGRSALWHGEIADCVHQNHIIRVRPYDIKPEFFDFYWNSPPGNQHVMDAAASTSGLYTLSVTKVSGFVIPVAPLAEQEQIVAEVERRLSVVSELEATIAVNLKRAERLRQSILERAFSGRLVPQDPADEPASAILERIGEEHNGRSGGNIMRAAMSTPVSQTLWYASE